MAKKQSKKKTSKKNSPTPQPQEPKENQETTQEDLPEVTTMGIYKTNSGRWAFIQLTTKGDQIIDKTETEYPTSKNIVFEELKIQIVKQFHRDY